MRRKAIVKKIGIYVMVLFVLFGGMNQHQSFETRKDYIIITNDGQVLNKKLTQAESLMYRDSYVSEDDIVEGFSSDLDTKEVEIVNVSEIENDNLEWNIKAINADNIAGNNSNNKVKVAIIDSGVDYSNEINLVDYVNFMPGEENLSPLFQDSTGHGTAIAGIIAAKDNDVGITGINENVEIYSAKVLDVNNRGSVSNVVKAIYWAIEKDVNIINMSFGINKDLDVLRKAVRDANKAGILIVAAVGNSGGEVMYPAAYNDVLAVGAVDEYAIVTEESCKGEEVDLVAPGEKIKSTAFLGSVMMLGGTSMSVPHVVGAASLLWQKDLSKSKNFIEELLKQTANKYGDSSSYGEGLLDVKYAVENYELFEQSFDENQIEEQIVEENETTIIQFEDVEHIEGLWSKKDHVSGVDDASNDGSIMSSTNNYKLLKICSGYPDVKFPDSKYRELHGKGNYIATLKYLYEVACKLRQNQENLIETIDTIASDSVREAVDIVINDTNISRKVSGEWVKNFLDATGLNEDSHNAKAAKVMGLAMHLIGDMYAHRTIMPQSAIYIYGLSSKYFTGTEGSCHFEKQGQTSTQIDIINDILINRAKNSSDWTGHKCWECFCETVEMGRMEFRDIPDLVTREAETLKENNVHPDSTEFFDKRYEVAIEIMRVYLVYFYYWEEYYFDVTNFYYNFQSIGIEEDDVIKLNNLYNYSVSAKVPLPSANRNIYSTTEFY